MNEIKELTAEYFHIIIHPLPIYGVGLGLGLLVMALLLKNRASQKAGLWMIFGCAMLAWPTYASGQKAYHKIYILADSDGQVSLDMHRERAEKLIYIFYGVAAIAAGAAILPRKFPKTALPLALAAVLAAAGGLGAGGWIAKAGGQIRHSEFRADWDESMTFMEEGDDLTDEEEEEGMGGSSGLQEEGEGTGER